MAIRTSTKDISVIPYVTTIVVGPLAVNCYILRCPQTRQAIVIDPGDDPAVINTHLKREKLEIRAIVNTHGHFDHVGANATLKNVTKAPILIHEADEPLLASSQTHARLYELEVEPSPAADRYLQDGDFIDCGSLRVRVAHTPGHSPGSIALIVHDVVFCGDTVFQGSIGRTDLPGAHFDQLLASIHTKLLSLPDTITLLPGHGPSSTIGHERNRNPFLGINN